MAAHSEDGLVLVGFESESVVEDVVGDVVDVPGLRVGRCAQLVECFRGAESELLGEHSGGLAQHALAGVESILG